MIRIDIGSLPEGHSRQDIEEDASQLDVDLEGVRFASPVKVSLDVTRNGDEIILTGRVSIQATLECARCLDEYACMLSGPIGVMVLIGEGPEEDAVGQEDVLRVPAGSKYADLTDEIRSELLVRVPLKPLCREECKGLCPTCGINLSRDACACRPARADSRWDALKNLKRVQ